MTRVAWLTDIHLNFLDAKGIARFLNEVAAARPDAVLLGGDIAEARDVARCLRQIAKSLTVQVYFVLGNHDYYFGSIAEVRESIRELTGERTNLVWLSEQEPIELAPGVGLVGHDGWADALLGDYMRSLVMMNDYRLIAELAPLDKQARLPVLRSLGQEAAQHIRQVLPVATDRFSQVVLLTHVPPWREACWHQGQISNDEWLPHFTCAALGEAIEEVMRPRAESQLTVLCGHTHSSGVCRPLENVTVLTAGAEYGRPQVERVFEF